MFFFPVVFLPEILFCVLAGPRGKDKACFEREPGFCGMCGVYFADKAAMFGSYNSAPVIGVNFLVASVVFRPCLKIGRWSELSHVVFSSWTPRSSECLVQTSSTGWVDCRKVTCYAGMFRNISATLMATGLTINPVNPWESLEKIRDLFHQNLILESEEKYGISSCRCRISAGWWWLEHEFYIILWLSILIGNNQSSQLTFTHSIIFQRGGEKPPALAISGISRLDPGFSCGFSLFQLEIAP